MKYFYTSILAMIAIFFGISANSGFSVRIASFSPQGITSEVQQVVAKFSHDVVPFGAPQPKEMPFVIDCPVKGTSAFIDTKTWVYNFSEPVKPGIKCSFAANKAFKDNKNNPIDAKQKFEFNTGGPSIIDIDVGETNHYDYANPLKIIPEDAVFVASVNAEVDKANVEKNCYFTVEGLGEPVGIELIQDKALLKKFKRRNTSEHNSLQLFIKPKRVFPQKAKVVLHWGKNISSKSGLIRADEQTFEFQVRSLFSLELSCTRESAKANCIPIMPMELRFAGLVSWDLAKKIVLRNKLDNTTISPKDISIGKTYVEDKLSSVEFEPPFREKGQYVVELPKDFIDDTGRIPENIKSFPLTFTVGASPALAKFAADFGIVEPFNKEVILPITVRNIEGKIDTTIHTLNADALEKDPMLIIEYHRVVRSHNREKPLLSDAQRKNSTKLALPKPLAKSETEVIGMPLPGLGLHMVEVKSQLLGKALLGKAKPIYVPALALATDLSAHLKYYADGALVFVTRLSTGKPEANAKVTLFNNLGILVTGTTDNKGIVEFKGMDALIEGLCKAKKIGKENLYCFSNKVYVLARVSNDVTYTFPNWDTGIEAWRFSLTQNYYDYNPEYEQDVYKTEPGDASRRLVHTVLARNLLRPGETVYMKHFIRSQDLKYIGKYKLALPAKLIIRHGASQVKYEVDVKWEANDSAITKFVIPKEAKKGTYSLSFVSPDNPKAEFGAGATFRLEDFKLPTLRADIIAPDKNILSGTPFSLVYNASYMSGGPAALLGIKIVNRVRDYYFNFSEELADYDFNFDTIKEGRTKKGVLDSETDEEDDAVPTASREAQTIKAALDGKGSYEIKVTDLPKSEKPKSFDTEMEYLDPNGEIQTVYNSVKLMPAKYVVGIKAPYWRTADQEIEVKALVVDEFGKPVKNAKVKVEAFKRQYFSNRKRLVGGFYAYESALETTKLASFCEGITNSSGVLVCSKKSPEVGEIVLLAQTNDEAGNKSSSTKSLRIFGEADNWYSSQGDNDRIDLVANKKTYEPGEIAKIQVNTTFNTATALVSVERNQILSYQVIDLSRANPTISIPIGDYFAPNVFVSVLLVRGRLGDPAATAMVDLGKPAMKLGIIKLDVGWASHKLKVEVNTDKVEYRVRDNAKVKIKITDSNKKSANNADVAVAVVDEALLALADNSTYDLLKAMMREYDYEIGTVTSQMQVIGKRHFGLKARKPGGGGGSGKGNARTNFDSLVKWVGSIKTDANGEATLDVPLNDSLSSFRIIAIAERNYMQFGTGTKTIQTSQPIQLFSGVSPVVRENDKYVGEFSVRNARNTVNKITIKARVKLPLEKVFEPRIVTLSPNATERLRFEVEIPKSLKTVEWNLEAIGDDAFSDKIKVFEEVIPVFKSRVIQGMLGQIDSAGAKIPLAAVNSNMPSEAKLSINFEKTIAGINPAVIEYMTKYPYGCLEQQISKVIALNNRDGWDSIMQKLPNYLNSNGLAMFFPGGTHGSVDLTSYILEMSHYSGWPILEDSEQAMLSVISSIAQGKAISANQRLAGTSVIEKIHALYVLSLYQRADPNLFESVTVNDALPLSALVEYHAALALLEKMPKNLRLLEKKTQDIIKTKYIENGTFIAWGAENNYWFLDGFEITTAKFVFGLLKNNDLNIEIPKVVRGLMAKNKTGHYGTTTSNAWVSLMLREFAKKFEKDEVNGITSITFGNQNPKIDWAKIDKQDAGKAGQTGKKQQVDFAWLATVPRNVDIIHTGKGKPWYFMYAFTADAPKEPINFGFNINRIVTPIEQKTKNKWSQGDLIQVEIKIHAANAAAWVVVEDPIPAGSSILRGSLAPSQDYYEGFYGYKETSFTNYREYFSEVEPGDFSISYTLRLNQVGRFMLPPTRVEAMYAPEMYAEAPNEVFEVFE